ncbi:MAG: hypothetical protein QOH63_3305 [Acidobacteriota bacterium]|jgi:hypothetical protein|nr:hypothetical protein [Acidobacteriota bacterium]
MLPDSVHSRLSPAYIRKRSISERSALNFVIHAFGCGARDVDACAAHLA